MNSYSLAGKVIETPEQCVTNAGTKYLKLKLEVEKNYKDNESSEIYEITLWGSLAEEEIKKGCVLGVRGHMSANSYEKDGKFYYNCSLVAEKLSCLA